MLEKGPQLKTSAEKCANSLSFLYQEHPFFLSFTVRVNSSTLLFELKQPMKKGTLLYIPPLTHFEKAQYRTTINSNLSLVKIPHICFQKLHFLAASVTMLSNFSLKR